MNIIKTNSCDSRARPGLDIYVLEASLRSRVNRISVAVNATHPGSESIAAADQRWVF